MIKKVILSAVALLQVLAIHGQLSTPVFTTYENEDQTCINGMSDNGSWAVTSGGSSAATRLINLDTKATTVISSEQTTEGGQDVSNDGNIVVGSNAGKPAYYNATTKKWTSLETKSPYVYGNAYSVTPDGKLAVGVLYYQDGMKSIPALWNIETGKLIETTGLPTKDMSHQDQGQMDFRQISSDGRYILGCMSYSYLPTSMDLGGCAFFVYNRDEMSCRWVGFSETTTGRWTPKADGIIVIMSATMSNNGKYITGAAHIARDVAGTEYADEYKVPFLYDVINDYFTCYDENSVQDTYGSAVSNDGIVIDVSPEGTPVREWSVSSSLSTNPSAINHYWFSFAEILKQKYDTDITAATGYDNTGTVNGISDDGKRLVSFPDPYKSYVVDLPVPVSEIGNGVKLLGSYSVSPVDNSEVSHLKNATLTFSRNITVVGNANSAQIIDKDGNIVYRSVGLSADGKTLAIRFRTGTLSDGLSYRLFLPEGTVAMDDDATQTNSDIYVAYKGREDVPVKALTFYPDEGTAFSHIDYSTSPVIVTFNTNIKLGEDKVGYLYRNDETTPFCQLTLAISGSKLALYPSTTQYLYDGSTYHVAIPAGAVTDVAGNNPNDSLVIDYIGNYIRQISPDDIILFSDNFDNGYANFMQWCGDQLTPTDAMVNWDFTKGMAWGLVRDSESSGDRMATSHSMYNPAGKSDDWLVIPQTYIPDMLCSVKFLSQSYLKSKNDTLKVIVWESNNVYNTLTEDIIAQMKSEGKVVYNQKQYPGENEESLGGEWTYNNISLAEFAGKNVYIAFVNQNTDQSAVFMDSLQVRHDMHFLTNLVYEESVVDKKEMEISGSLIGNNSDVTYSNATITLRDSDGKTIDTVTLSDMKLSKDTQCKFSFSKPLPLTVGIENKFTLLVNVDGESNEIKGSVKDLAFQPVKRIVLEEYTGRSCGNCPLGILAIEKLQSRYGKLFIPVSVHTYNNDPLSSGLSSYTATLGFSAAPSGIINRSGTVSYPAVSATVNDIPRYFFTNTDTDLPNETEKLWMDYADEEMATPAECSIEITGISYNEYTGNMTANCEMKYALSAKNQTVNLFTVLLEDNCSQAQQNYMASIASPDLGEWGLGGKYGQSVVTDFLHQDVAKNVNGTTINGTGGYLPATIEAGKVYSASVSIPVPSTVSDKSQCKMVIMMIDANTGKVINAACSERYGQTGIEQVQRAETRAQRNVCYNITGQRVNTNVKGIIIINGKKIIK